MREVSGSAGTELGYGTGIPILGQSAALRQVIELAKNVARTNASVFLSGESGTGKELVAQFIHQNSRRSSRSMVSVNCAAIPDNLVESEMFGHVAGAFTGAVSDKKGLMEIASGGTLFLDELTEMPMPTQAKLLRVIQDGVIRRVGSTKTDVMAEVRFIASMNEDAAEALEEKRLRKGLYYRLRVFPIHIPPLRERPEDIEALAEAFLDEFWTRHRGKGTRSPGLYAGSPRGTTGTPLARQRARTSEHHRVYRRAATPRATTWTRRYPLLRG